MAEAIKGVPRILVKKSEPKPRGLMVLENTLSSTDTKENKTAPDFYCPGNVERINENGKIDNIFFVSPPPGEPDFTHEGLNKFMHSLVLSQVFPGFTPNTKTEYKESHTSRLGHFELGRIEFTIDQPGVKNPFIDIGEKPVESGKQIIIIYPYDRIATLVYEYQDGVVRGETSDDNPNFHYALYRLTNDQLEEFKKQASEEQSNFT